MEFGAHLPLISFQGEHRGLAELQQYTKLAAALGYKFLCANDHFVFSRPWLDGPTALAAVVASSGTMKLATTVSIPIVRGPVASAKVLAALDILSGGRLIVGVGPGSSAKDYAAAGIPFEERWKRLDEVIRTLRALWDLSSGGFHGKYYSTEGLVLEPRPVQQPGPPIWIGSWGSPAGLRRVARLGDGWLASGYNTTPKQFSENVESLGAALLKQGRDAAGFPNGIATMWFYVTEDRGAADRMVEDVLSPMLKRPVEELRDKLPIGDPETCAEKLSAYARVGAQRVFLWPLADELQQLEAFSEKVSPMVLAAA